MPSSVNSGTHPRWVVSSRLRKGPVDYKVNHQ